MSNFIYFSDQLINFNHVSRISHCEYEEIQNRYFLNVTLGNGRYSTIISEEYKDLGLMHARFMELSKKLVKGA